MKRFEFSIDAYQLDWITKAIRSKKDVILLLMRAMKIMMLPEISNPGVAGKIVLQVAKMNRLFFVMEDKIFSICFPFTAIENRDLLFFRSINHMDVNSKVASDVISLLESNRPWESGEVLHFAEPISDYCESDSEFWSLIRDLMLYEDGYIRYDCDPTRRNGHFHPLHHLDVFYTTGSTFKLGLEGQVSLPSFTDVLDLGTECHYIAPAT